jgi:hypothetical protein
MISTGPIGFMWIASPGIALSLKAGQLVAIQDKDDPSNILEATIQYNTDPPVPPNNQLVWLTSATSLKSIPAGSKVFIPPRVYSGQIDVAFDEISLSVRRDELRSSLNGKLLGEVNTVSGSSITLKSPFLKHRIYKDDTVTFAPNAAFGQTEGTTPTVKKTVTKSGSPSYWDAAESSITLDSYGGISADMLMYMDNAGPVSIGSSLQVFIDSIIIDTPVLKSGNYEPGVDGWAINGDGSAEFNDVAIRGDILLTIGDGKAINDRSSVFWALNPATATVDNVMGLYFKEIPLSVGVEGFFGGFWDPDDNYGLVDIDY